MLEEDEEEGRAGGGERKSRSCKGSFEVVVGNKANSTVASTGFATANRDSAHVTLSLLPNR